MKTNSPSEQEIARRAREIWQTQGQPTGQDVQIWLEAERQLTIPPAANNRSSSTVGADKGKMPPSQTPANAKPAGASAKSGVSGQTERLRGEMASESEVEFQITPAPTDDEAIKAALQKRDARAPQRPAKDAPHAKPAETGKPLWSKPHSS